MTETKSFNLVEEVRLANLRLLIEECPKYRKGSVMAHAGTLVALAFYCNTSDAYLSQILTRFTPKETGKVRQLGSRLARKLEEGMGKPQGWMDVVHDNIDPAENEFRLIYAAMNEDQKAAILEHAKLISKIGKK